MKILCFFRNVSSQGPNDAKQTSRSPLALPKSQGLREMFRDVLGCLLVMYVSIIVYLTDSSVAKFVDPVFAIFSAITLFTLSYPYSEYYTYDCLMLTLSGFEIFRFYCCIAQ